MASAPASTRPGSAFPAGRSALAVCLAVLLAPPLRAELHFAGPAANAGEVRAGKPLLHRFDFVNRGAAPAEITDVRPGCGCLVSRLEKRTFAPGEAGTLPVEVHTLGQAEGEHAWQVRVLARAGGKEEETTLSLTARVRAEVVVRPAALTLFAGSAAGHEVMLTDRRPRPLMVTAVSTTLAALKATLTESSVDAAGHRTCKIVLELAADCPEGRHETALQLFTDDPDYPELKVPVTVVMRPRRRLGAAPEVVELAVPREGPVPSRLVRVRDAHDQDVEVDRVEADDPAVVCQWAKGPNRVGTVKVTADRQRLPAGGLRSAVHLHVVKPVGEVLTIPVVVSGP